MQSTIKHRHLYLGLALKRRGLVQWYLSQTSWRVLNSGCPKVWCIALQWDAYSRRWQETVNSRLHNLSQGSVWGSCRQGPISYGKPNNQFWKVPVLRAVKPPSCQADEEFCCYVSLMKFLTGINHDCVFSWFNTHRIRPQQFPKIRITGMPLVWPRLKVKNLYKMQNAFFSIKALNSTLPPPQFCTRLLLLKLWLPPNICLLNRGKK